MEGGEREGTGQEAIDKRYMYMYDHEEEIIKERRLGTVGEKQQ